MHGYRAQCHDIFHESSSPKPGGKLASGEFAAGVSDAGGNLPLVSTTPTVNLLPESTTLWVTNDTQNAYTLN